MYLFVHCMCIYATCMHFHAFHAFVISVDDIWRVPLTFVTLPSSLPPFALWWHTNCYYYSIINFHLFVTCTPLYTMPPPTMQARVYLHLWPAMLCHAMPACLPLTIYRACLPFSPYFGIGTGYLCLFVDAWHFIMPVHCWVPVVVLWCLCSHRHCACLPLLTWTLTFIAIVQFAMPAYICLCIRSVCLVAHLPVTCLWHAWPLAWPPAVAFTVLYYMPCPCLPFLHSLFQTFQTDHVRQAAFLYYTYTPVFVAYVENFKEK